MKCKAGDLAPVLLVCSRSACCSITLCFRITWKTAMQPSVTAADCGTNGVPWRP